ncbi:shikimate kinase [Stappia indica]|uniref:shikimate kinase n=1 Tax=Stappia indica TaxID=538381 RepID=UPI000836ACC8|nr:shikimate kinase [Stappia indica]
MSVLPNLVEEERAARLVTGLGTRSIVLVGIMGCGKSSVGRRLAQTLSLPFVDADTEIEAAANLTIPEIFAQHGEAYFRAGEQRVIARLLKNGPQILATGGGAYMNAETRAAVREMGLSIWLKADFALVMNRVRRKPNRPLLNDPDPEGVMRRLLAEREPVYAEAELTIQSRDVPHEAVVADIVAALEAHFGFAPALSDQAEGASRP